MSDFESWGSDSESDEHYTMSSAETLEFDTSRSASESTRVRVRIESVDDALLDTATHEHVRLLQRRNQVLSTLCGFETWLDVVDAAVRIQSCARGFRLRRDKRVFDRCLSIFLSQCRMIVQRKRYMRWQRAIRTIQACARGVRVRSTRLGRTMQRLMQSRREIVELELTVLRIRNRR